MREDASGPTMFLTNHALVLGCIDLDPHVRLRDVAVQVGITERAAQMIVADLVAAGYLSRTRVGRRNHYVIHHDRPIGRPDHGHLSVGGLLAYLRGPTPWPLPAQANV